MSVQIAATAGLADYATGVEFEHLPAAVVHAAKRAILDSLGCSIGGGRTEPGGVLLRFFDELGGAGGFRVLASDRRLSVLQAVYVNSALANLLDVDDSLGEGHLGATVVPPAVTAAGLAPTAGRDLIAAVVAGYEVSARIGTAIRPSAQRFREVRGLGTFQVFGAAAAVGRLLRLEPATMRSAFGIAGANAPVPSVYKEGIGERPLAWVKNNFGWAAEGGVLGVLLAARGYRGQTSFLDGDKGFWKMAGSDQCDFDAMIAGLGREYRILENSFKPYACCRYHHTALDAIRDLLEAPTLDRRKIENIHVRGIWRVSEHIKPEPEDLIDAQYSLPFQIAGHVLGRASRFDWLLNSALTDRDLVSMGHKVTFEQDAGHEQLFQAARTAASTVTITTPHMELTKTVEYAWGSSQHPITDRDLERKFLDFVEPVLGDDGARSMAALIWNLEAVNDVHKAIEQGLGTGVPA